jgi:TorA maturation chaperone TorD
MPELEVEPKVAEILRQSAQWRLLGLLFECPGEGWQSQLDELAKEAGDEELTTAAEAARGEASPELYHTVFGPGGPAAVREVSYLETLIPGQSIADLQAFYDAFAYQPALDEPPDHAAVMLGFVSYLLLKEAYAVARGDVEQVEITADAATKFIEKHLADIAPPLARLLESSDIRYLALAGMALRRRGASLKRNPHNESQPC